MKTGLQERRKRLQTDIDYNRPGLTCRISAPLCLALCVLLFSGCTNTEDVQWAELIPETSLFVIIPDEGSTIEDLSGKTWAPLIEDISNSTLQAIEELQQPPGSDIIVESIILFPATSDNWLPVWITDVPDGFTDELTDRYQREFAQNSYQFRGYNITRLSLPDRQFYTVKTGLYTLFSESSLGIEEVIRSFQSKSDRLQLTDSQKEPGNLVINFPNLDQWVKQMALVSHRPNIDHIFDGSRPVAVQLSSVQDENIQWNLTGSLLPEENLSLLMRGVSAPSALLTLDRYIPSSAAAFSILQLAPRTAPPADSTAVTDLDNYISANPDLYADLASSLEAETAFAAFAETGVSSSSDFLFLRSLSDTESLQEHLDELADRELIDAVGDIYYIRSSWLSRLFAAEYSPLTDFYLGIYGDAVVSARGRSLVENVGADLDRRQVILYNDHYISAREQMTANLSSLTWSDTPRFINFIEPWLSPQSHFDPISHRLDLFIIATYRENGDSELTIEMMNYQREAEDLPFREQWVFSIGNVEISGLPILADIGGSPRSEIILTTENGTVYTLAGDGSVDTQTSTGSDEPVGSPVVYDWYGNGRNVIMQAAGNKIYAWTETGEPLPNFPVIMPELITAPLLVTDITRNGVPEMVVSTADRNLHILNSRGEPVNGWPRMTNTVVTSRPLISELSGQRSIFVFSENVVNAWNPDGERRQGFPLFTGARFNGSPAIYGNHLLGAASDGNLYAIGTQRLFEVTLENSATSDSLIVQSLNVANSSLNATPGVSNQMIRVGEELVREDLILLQSASGSVFLYNGNGELRFTQSMEQAAALDTAPFITDINNNGRQNVVALAELGRLYAWDLISENRIFDLPTTGISYPLIVDLDNDEYMELIGNTRDGLRMWTIFR